MFSLKPSTLAGVEPLVRRVLIVDPNAHIAKLLAESLKTLGSRDVTIEPGRDRGMQAAAAIEPTLIVTEFFDEIDGPAFIRGIRKSSLACRKAPIMVLSANATTSTIKAARDAGAHEFLRKPFSQGDLLRRLENLSRIARPWVDNAIYTGPDRRRFNSGAGMRRASDMVEAGGI